MIAIYNAQKENEKKKIGIEVVGEIRLEDRGVVDHHTWCAEALCHGAYQLRGNIGIGQVGQKHLGLAARIADDRCSFLRFVLRRVGMNGDLTPPGERCASTSNRNFKGRQGPGSRTHLMSPAMAAAAAIMGRITDIRELEPVDL